VRYLLLWIGLLAIGLYQQSNLILLIAAMAAGPVVASALVSTSMLRRLRVSRRAPAHAFSGDPLAIEYTMENPRRRSAALALTVDDDMAPLDRTIYGASHVTPKVFFARVPGQSSGRLRWQGTAPERGRYRFSTLEIGTGSPFGLLERRMTIAAPGEIVIYPRVGQLNRRWHQMQRESTETRRGNRHDRTAQQQDYHGLRDYRPGDSPRWIHWRTTARLGQPMVKEFEQQNDQDLALLLDPWLPRSKVTAEQREALEDLIRFAATVSLETCRGQGRRLILGWTGATSGLVIGPASIKLLHEILGQLAVLRPSIEGQLSGLLDTLPPAILRDAAIVIVSTRALNLNEEAERSARLSGASGRGLAGRAVMLNVSRGDLAEYWQDTSRRVPPETRKTVADPGVSDGRPAHESNGTSKHLEVRA
jgi:uncharacterized protein (DUF58 family)